MTEFTTTSPLLAFEQARYDARGREAAATLNVQLRVMRRQLVLVRCDRQNSVRLLADACCGLVQPVAGEARFLGRSWSDVPLGEAQAMRGMIGQAFERGAWLDDLSVAENVLLQQSYHTRRPSAELRAEAGQLANRLGLPGLPTVTPDALSAEDLQRAALVRALLGNPALVILQQPTRAAPDLLAPLMTLITQAQQRATAVLWLTAETSPPGELGRICDQSVRIRQSGQMEPMT